MTKQIYKEFLKHCCARGICVSAHQNVPNGGRSHPPHPQIAVNRVGSKHWIVGPISDDADLDDFIDGSSNISRELGILLNEYGHYSCNHPDIDLNTQAGMQKGYKEEQEAWAVGRDLLTTFGATPCQLNEFDIETENALKTYRQGMLGAP